MSKRVIITKSRKPTSHGRHAALTAMTGGMWAPIWACIGAWHAAGPRHTTRTTIITREK